MAVNAHSSKPCVTSAMHRYAREMPTSTRAALQRLVVIVSGVMRTAPERRQGQSNGDTVSRKRAHVAKRLVAVVRHSETVEPPACVADLSFGGSIVYKQIIAFAGAILLLFAPELAHAQGQPSVTIAPFEDTSNSGQAETLRTMIASTITQTRKFRVIEYDISTLQNQRGRQASGQVASRRGTRNTPIADAADYIITGSITSWSVGGQGNILASMGCRISGACDTQCTRQTLTLSLDIQILDEATNEVRYAKTETRTGRSGTNCVGGATIDPTTFFREIANDISSGLVASVFPMQVAAVQSDGTIIINYGEGSVASDALLTIFQRGNPIPDPSNPERNLGFEETALGIVRVTEVTPALSRAQAVSTFAVPPPVGSILREATEADRQRFGVRNGRRSRN